MTWKRRRRRRKSKAQFLGPHGRWFTYNFLSLSLALFYIACVFYFINIWCFNTHYHYSFSFCWKMFQFVCNCVSWSREEKKKAAGKSEWENGINVILSWLKIWKLSLFLFLSVFRVVGKEESIGICNIWRTYQCAIPRERKKYARHAQTGVVKSMYLLFKW